MANTSHVSSNNEIDNVPSYLTDDEIKEAIDKIIQKWTIGLNEKKNLLYLLSTLHEVWTCDPTWKEVSMKELVEDKKLVRVKKF